MNDIKDRIKKLLAHAKSAKQLGSLEEAKAFMAKAQELMTRHAIEEDELKTDSESGLEKRTIDLTEIKSAEEGRTLVQYINVMCREYMCEVVFAGTISGQMIAEVYGPGQYIDVMWETASTIWLQLRKWAREDYKRRKKHTRSSRSKYIRSYLEGCTQSLYEKMLYARKRVLLEYEETGLIVQQYEASRAFAHQHYGENEIKSRKPRKTRKNNTAYARGYVKADQELNAPQV